MSFGVPAALWFLAALPVIVFLHMLRTRRQDLPISSVLLWQRARDDLLAHRPVRRVQRSLLLVLQLLVATLVALALAQPRAMLSAAGGPATVVVVDVSVRMQATDVAPSRFEAARAAALEEILRRPGVIMVVRAGAQPRAMTGFVNRAAARAAVGNLQPTDAPAQLDQAVTLAQSQRSDGGRVRVVVFTDHAMRPVPGVEYHIMGRSGRNLAVTGVRAERTVGGVAAIVQVRNAGPAAERVPLTVTLDGQPILTRTLEIPATTTVAVPVTLKGEGVLTARIDPHDPLATDDVGYAVIGGPPVRVLVVGARDRALEEALQAAGGEVSTPRPGDAASLAAADVVVLNRTPPVDLPPGSYILLGTTAPNLPVTADGIVPSPHLLRWSRSHPVMRYVDLRDVTIARTLALQPRGGEVLAEGEVPLIWAYDGAGLRVITLGFNLQDSDLPLHMAFPIVLHNALSWLTGTGLAYEAGQPLIVPARTQSEAVLIAPDGSRAVLTAQDGKFVVPVLERVGIYTLELGGRSHRIAVNAAASAVDITPGGSVLQQPMAAPGAPAQRTANLAPVLLAVALLVLLGEWTLWLRRLPRLQRATPRPAVKP
jgi:hypothetical protein